MAVQTKHSTLRRWAPWGISFLLALAFAGAGGSKLAGSEMLVESFARWGYPGWFMYGVGAAEVAGAVAVLVPRFAAIGGVWLATIMTGAVGTHLLNAEYAEWVPASVLLLLSLTLTYLRRDSLRRWLGWAKGSTARA